MTDNIDYQRAGQLLKDVICLRDIRSGRAYLVFGDSRKYQAATLFLKDIGIAGDIGSQRVRAGLAGAQLHGMEILNQPLMDQICRDMYRPEHPSPKHLDGDFVVAAIAENKGIMLSLGCEDMETAGPSIYQSAKTIIDMFVRVARSEGLGPRDFRL